MNIGFSDGNIEYWFTENNVFIFFHFCNFVFSACPICNIYLLDTFVFVCINAASFNEIIVLFYVKAKLSAFVHQNAREV